MISSPLSNCYCGMDIKLRLVSEGFSTYTQFFSPVIRYMDITNGTLDLRFQADPVKTAG